jgi:hypothetical protein
MGLIEYYVIFALTTGITSCYLFLAPAINNAKSKGIINSFTINTNLSYLIYILSTAIFAPLTIFPIIFDVSGKKFMTGIEKVVLEPNE